MTNRERYMQALTEIKAELEKRLHDAVVEEVATKLLVNEDLGTWRDTETGHDLANALLRTRGGKTLEALIALDKVISTAAEIL